MPKIRGLKGFTRNFENKGRVKDLIIKGKNNEEIATELNISVGVVKYHLTSILKSEKVKSRAALIAKCLILYTNEEHKSNFETLQRIILQQDEKIVELTKIINSIKDRNLLPGIKI